MCAQRMLWDSVVMTAFALMKALCVLFFFGVMISATVWLVEFALKNAVSV